MTHLDLFAGVHAVLYAMFCEDESLDLEAMTHQVEYCIEVGCHGITVLGLATEVQKLTLDERKTLVTCVTQVNRGRLPLSVTIAGNSVAEQVDLGWFAQENGADWLILQPPMVGNYAAEIYLDFFERVAKSLKLPVAIQNAPQYLGRSLSAEDIFRLQDRCTNFVCVKSEDTVLGMQRIIALTKGTLHVLGGRGGLEMTDNLRAGCEGFILAPDIAPMAVRIFETFRNGQVREAEHLYAQALPAITFVMQSLEHLITYGKRIFATHAGLTVQDRTPFLPPTELGLQTADRWAKHIAGLATK